MAEVSPSHPLVPGPATAGVAVHPTNNNLDLCRHRGRWYLAWRTAPTHFASPEARIEVTSATDLDGPWRHETTIHLGSDVREPRWADDGEVLRLFLVELGRDAKRFQPRRVHTCHRDVTTGSWTAPEVAVDEPVVAWRIRRLAGRWAMSTYRGAERMYGPRPVVPTVELRWSDDLATWSDPEVIHVGGTECELVELPDGRTVGVVRNEGPSRFGSDVLIGPTVDALVPHPIPEKLDSPCLFLWDGVPHVVARRSLGFGGRYDLAPRWVPGAAAIRIDQLAWWVTRKRSTLWRIDLDARRVVPVVDLPSGGDTSFAAVHVEDDGSLIVADYRSRASGGDPIWVRGQLRPTDVHWVRIRG